MRDAETKPKDVLTARMGERMSDEEIAAYRAQFRRGLDAVQVEADRRGPRSPHPRIVAARLAGKNV